MACLMLQTFAPQFQLLPSKELKGEKKILYINQQLLTDLQTNPDKRKLLTPMKGINF